MHRHLRRYPESNWDGTAVVPLSDAVGQIESVAAVVVVAVVVVVVVAAAAAVVVAAAAAFDFVGLKS